MASFYVAIVLLMSVYTWSDVRGKVVVSQKYDRQLQESAHQAEELRESQAENRNDQGLVFSIGDRPAEIGSGDPLCHTITYRDQVQIFYNIAEQCMDRIAFENCCQPRFVQLYQSGVYPIVYGKHGYGYCDMETDGGGWLVVLRRAGGRRSFDKTWKQYKRGFGPLDRDFWAGLDTLYHLTRYPTEMRVDLQSENGTWYHAYYETFAVGPESLNYQLFISGYDAEKSTIHDSLLEHNGFPFSTKDRNNMQGGESAGCFAYFVERLGAGGWWYLDVPPAPTCFISNLNDKYYLDVPTGEEVIGIQWPPRDDGRFGAWKFVYAEMKIRPKRFECGRQLQDWSTIQKLFLERAQEVEAAEEEEGGTTGESITLSTTHSPKDDTPVYG